MVKNATDEAINKIVGIDEEDRKFIRENKDLVNDTLSKKKNVETIVDEVKSKIDDKRLANTEM
jgi:low affinity Fe/Cu permease